MDEVSQLRFDNLTSSRYCYYWVYALNGHLVKQFIANREATAKIYLLLSKATSALDISIVDCIPTPITNLPRLRPSFKPTNHSKHIGCLAQIQGSFTTSEVLTCPMLDLNYAKSELFNYLIFYFKFIYKKGIFGQSVGYKQKFKKN